MNLNLRTSIVEDYYDKKSKRLTKILGIMKNVEYWVLDNERSVMEDVNKLADLLNGLREDDEYKLMENSNEILRVLAYLSCSKALFFMTWLDETFNKDIAVDFVKRAEELYDEDPEYSIHIERLDTINKINIIGNIFSNERLTKIVRILDSIKDKINDSDDYEYY